VVTLIQHAPASVHTRVRSCVQLRPVTLHYTNLKTTSIALLYFIKRLSRLHRKRNLPLSLIPKHPFSRTKITGSRIYRNKVPTQQSDTISNMASPSKTQNHVARNTHGTDVQPAQTSIDLVARTASELRTGRITHEQQSAIEGNDGQVEVC
jgi:hypothetical protein